MKKVSSLDKLVLGQHFFVSNPVTGKSISPKWDFTNVQKNPNFFVVVDKKAAIPAPTGPQDVDWLDLTNISGSLSFEVYRTDTRGGQPPKKCQPGSSPISVKYTAIYYFTRPKSA
ncbi:hypothetical protein L218DRAFT_707052 [Marasmius fiardii PR-910]|nr:hypothetical protein L218DRAFT_707052 [Marasmius fiardii PR-910]